MPYYKDQASGIHCIDSAEFEYLLPPGSVAITEQEALALLSPTIDQLKLQRTSAINAACAAAITGGFTSSALGTFHRYDSAEIDQLNLIGAVSQGVSVPYSCADSTGIKAMRLHTAAQLKQVLADGAAVKIAALDKARTLKDQISAAVDVAAVDSVVW